MCYFVTRSIPAHGTREAFSSSETFLASSFDMIKVTAVKLEAIKFSSQTHSQFFEFHFYVEFVRVEARATDKWRHYANRVVNDLEFPNNKSSATYSY